VTLLKYLVNYKVDCDFDGLIQRNTEHPPD
jgi:hypothetical protein